MNINMEMTINNLKNNFTQILDEKNNITKALEMLIVKINTLKKTLHPLGYKI